MARDGSGNYTRIHNWVTDLANSIPITASRMDAEMDSEATALTNSLDRSASGGGDILRDVGMSNHKFTSMSDGSALTDSIVYKQVQNGEILFFGTTAGTSTVYTLAPSPSIDALDTGMFFWFKVNTACGDDPTINISAKGAKSLKYILGSSTKYNIKTNQLPTNKLLLGQYDGTDVLVWNADIHTEATQTLSSGIFAYNQPKTILASETGTTDDCTGCSGGNTGDVVSVRPDTGDVITLKHSATLDLRNQLDVELLDGNDIVTLYCKSSGNWTELSRTIRKDRGIRKVFLETKEASNDATIDFTSNINSTYSNYLVEFTNVQPATDNVEFQMHISEDGGSSWKSGAADYGYANSGYSIAGVNNNADSSATFISLSDATINEKLSNGATDSYCGEIKFYNPSGTSFKKIIRGNASYITSGGTPKDIFVINISGQYQGTTNAINAFRFFMSSGNIASGTFKLYGLR